MLDNVPVADVNVPGNPHPFIIIWIAVIGQGALTNVLVDAVRIQKAVYYVAGGRKVARASEARISHDVPKHLIG